MKSIIVGGGWSGVAAAIAAKKAGAEVELYEKTDMLLGLGNVGGIMRNNGRYTATEELIALGAAELFNITDKYSRHKNMNFPGHEHAWIYDVNKIEPAVRNLLLDMNIIVHMVSRVVNIEIENKQILGLYLADGSYVTGDVFIDTTGSTGPMGNCIKYGHGCVMCVLRCPTFGPRISISSKAGIEDLHSVKLDGTYGAFSGSCELCKESIDETLLKEIEKNGVVILKVPAEDVNMDKLKSKVCQQYALKEFAENVVLIDTGHVKLMTSYYPLEKLRKIHGLENVKFIDPYSGGIGNSVRYLSISPRDDDMRVTGIENLFCAGEKAGLFVGHTEAIGTGSLAGNNSVRYSLGLETLILPDKTAIGDIILYVNSKMKNKEGIREAYTFAGAVYFERMKTLGLYSIDNDEIKERINKLGLTDIFNKKITNNIPKE